MATDPRYRGCGAGGALVESCLAHAARICGIGARGVFWCNARTNVQGFYERYGLRMAGQPYDIPTVGPHIFMWKVFDGIAAS
jgi:L-Ala-D/L-Glu epimerase